MGFTKDDIARLAQDNAKTRQIVFDFTPKKFIIGIPLPQDLKLGLP